MTGFGRRSFHCWSGNHKVTADLQMSLECKFVSCRLKVWLQITCLTNNAFWCQMPPNQCLWEPAGLFLTRWAVSDQNPVRRWGQVKMVVIDCLLVDLHGAGGSSVCQGNPFSSLGSRQSASKTTERASVFPVRRVRIKGVWLWGSWMF